MSHSLLNAIKRKNYSAANQYVAQTLLSKVSERLAVERKTLMTEDKKSITVEKGQLEAAKKFCRQYNVDYKVGETSTTEGDVLHLDGAQEDVRALIKFLDRKELLVEATDSPRYHVVVADKYLTNLEKRKK